MADKVDKPEEIKEDKLDFEPGIYTDISFEDYVKIDAVNHSTLKEFKKDSPLHYKHRLDNEVKEEKKAFDDGRLYHMSVLEFKRFEEEVIHRPKHWKDYEHILPEDEVKKLKKNPNRLFDGRTKANKIVMPFFEEQVKEKIKENPKIIVCDYLEYWKALQIRNSVLSNKSCKKILKNAKYEVTLIWIDPETGLKCKGRLDIDQEGKGYFADLKKTRNAHPYGFAKDFRTHNYYSQFAFYADGAQILGYKELKAAMVIAVEDFEPFYVQPFYVKMESSWITKGRDWYKSAIEELHYCMSTGHWHGYYDKYNDNFDLYELPELMNY